MKNGIMVAFALVMVLLIVPSLALAGSAKIKLAAVSGDGQGILSDLEVEVVAGKGRILLTAEPLMGLNVQGSEKLATEMARKITKASLDDKDVIFTIHSDATMVDGPSAGAAMTIATISAITGNPFRNGTIITGTIEEDGTIGQVGGVLKKAKAVSDAGAGEFLIPKGQRVQTEYVKKTESPAPGIYVETLQPMSIDVVEYAKSKWGLEVVEVGSIDEAVKIMFGSGKNLTEVTQETPKPQMELPATEVSAAEGQVRYVAERQMERAKAAVAESNSSEGRKLLSDAQELLDKGYFYSAANSAFLSAVVAKSSRGSAADLKPELEARLAEEEKKLVELNSTGFYYADELQALAAAQQRYLWAEGSVSSGDASSLAAGGEWLHAFGDMLRDVRKSGARIGRESLQAKADLKLDDAQKALMDAEAVGGDLADATRSLGFAMRAKAESLPLAQLFNSIDAEAYALAAGESGSLSSLAEKARRSQSKVSTGWSASYMKHSKYLLFLAERDNSRDKAIDSIFMALRAKGVEEAFTDLPAIRPAAGTTNAADLVGIVVFLIFTIAVWIMWLEIRVMRREQRNTLERIEQLLLTAKGGRGRK